ncbi:MAG: helix-turn-helix domain-containing protein [Nitrospira sp.]
MAKICRVSRATVYRWIEQGKMQTILNGARSRFNTMRLGGF